MKSNLLRCIWFAATLGISSFQVHAQLFLAGGGHLVIANGATLTSLLNVNVEIGGELVVDGTLILKSDLNNAHQSNYNLGNGTTEFSGTLNQNVTGQNIFHDLSLNNAAGLNVGGNTQVMGILTLSNGLATLGDYNLLLGPNASVVAPTGANFSATNMIVPTGTGEFRKEFVTSTGSFLFPVGDNTGSPEYSPVTLNFVSGTFPTGNYAGVSLVNDKFPNPNIQGNYLNRYWNISQSGIANFSCNASFKYLPADVVGVENKLSCTGVSPSPWTTYSPADIVNKVIYANGVTNFFSLSSWTGLKSIISPINLQLANINISPNVVTCYDAVQVITVAGNGNTFKVENSGSVTLVAGQKVSFQPLTIVYAGGYLHAYISTTGCGSMLNPLVTNPADPVKESELQPLQIPAKDQFIRIYPNPTEDIVIIEFLHADPGSTVNIDIYNMNGQRITSKVCHDEIKQQFSLAGLPVGIYMVHVRSESRSEYAKIIKK